MRRLLIPVTLIALLTLATGCWSGQSDAEPVAVVGDSIVSDGYSGQEIKLGLNAAGFRYQVSGKPGDRWDQRLDITRQYMASSPTPRQVVFNLGTNDATQAGKGTWDLADSEVAFAEAMRIVEPAECMHLVTVNTRMLHGPANDAAGQINARYAYEASVNPDVRIVDWNAAVIAYYAAGSPDGPLTTDGIHPTQVGQDLLARLIVESVDGCRAPIDEPAQITSMP